LARARPVTQGTQFPTLTGANQWECFPTCAAACGVLAIHLEPPGDVSYSIEITCGRCSTALARTVDATAAARDLISTDLLLAFN
jgi:hypothetical protein